MRPLSQNKNARQKVTQTPPPFFLENFRKKADFSWRWLPQNQWLDMTLSYTWWNISICYRTVMRRGTSGTQTKCSRPWARDTDTYRSPPVTEIDNKWTYKIRLYRVQWNYVSCNTVKLRIQLSQTYLAFSEASNTKGTDTITVNKTQLWTIRFT